MQYKNDGLGNLGENAGRRMKVRRPAMLPATGKTTAASHAV
jgi:hypothetical protein